MKDKMIALLLLFCSTFASGFYIQPDVVVFSRSPRNQVVCDGCRLELTCVIPKQNTSANLPHPEIQWLLNDTLITDGAGSRNVERGSNEMHIFSRLVIGLSSSADSGRYQCRALDGSDMAACSNVVHGCVPTVTLSSPAWIQVISNVSASRTVETSVYSSALLQCGSRISLSAGQLDQIPINWSRNGTDISSGASNHEEMVLSNGDLLVYTSSGPVGTLYDCFLFLEDGLVHYQSYRLQASQSGTPGGLSISSTHRVAYTGSKVELTCSVTARQALNVSWTKTMGETNVTLRTGMDASDLYGLVFTLEEVVATDSGRYCCKADPLQADCIQLQVTEREVSLPPRPSQQFIHWRNNNTIHSVHISCPMQLPFRTISWFRNGVRLVNATERDLSRSSSDPAMLYGVYQCLVRSPELESRDILTVTRVMPYGVSNPPGNIRVQELPWPKLPVLVLWRAPFYTGNLSLYSYKAQVDSRTTAVTNRTSDVFYPVFPRLNIEISLYDEESMETLSDRNDPVVYDITNMCQFHRLNPPIVHFSCDMGMPRLSWRLNSTANQKFLHLIQFLSGQTYYLRGECRNENGHKIYQLQTPDERFDNSTNAFTFNNGTTFQVGTRCTASAANTGTPDNTNSCYDRQYLNYTEPVSCLVKASVGFDASECMVDESALSAEVCVRASGFGFTVNVTVISLTASESDYDQTELITLNISSPHNSLICGSISISDDSIVEPNESIMLMLTAADPHVVITRNTSRIVIVSNDNATASFQPSNITVSESRTNVSVCTKLEGTLGRSVSVMVKPVNQTAISEVGSSFEGREVTFTPGSRNTYCFHIDILTNDIILNSNKIFILLLTSNDTRVSIGTSHAFINIQDDDNVVVSFVSNEYTVRRSDKGLNVCVEMQGLLGKTIEVSVNSIGQTAGEGFATVRENLIFSPVMLSTSISVKCFNVTVTGFSSMPRKQFQLRLGTTESGVMLSSDTTIYIDATNGTTDPVEMAIIVVVVLLITISSCVVLVVVASLLRRKRYEMSIIWKKFDRNDTITAFCEDDSVRTAVFSLKPFHKSDENLDSISLILSLAPTSKCQTRTSSEFETETPNLASTSTIGLGASSPEEFLTPQISSQNTSAGYLKLDLKDRLNDENFIPRKQSVSIDIDLFQVGTLSPDSQDTASQKIIPSELNMKLSSLCSSPEKTTDASALCPSSPTIEHTDLHTDPKDDNDSIAQQKSLQYPPQDPQGLQQDSGFPAEELADSPDKLAQKKVDSGFPAEELLESPDMVIGSSQKVDSGYPAEDSGYPMQDLEFDSSSFMYDNFTKPRHDDKVDAQHTTVRSTAVVV